MPDVLSIAGREHDLGGGFVVRRLLPDVKRRSVGPFIVLDPMGPHAFPPGQGAVYPLEDGLVLDGEPLRAGRLHVLPARGSVAGESEFIPLPER